jgi:prepilin-type N-terminal cleavage/methylation domain-containing protein
MENDVSALSRVKGRLVKGEVGFSLIELVVAISLFSVFIALFLTAVVTLIRGTEQVTSTSEASSKSLIVFQNIDRQVRYADSINFPGDGSSGARYIEYRLPASSAPSGITTCYQWRFVPSTGQIQLRQWHDTV